MDPQSLSTISQDQSPQPPIYEQERSGRGKSIFFVVGILVLLTSGIGGVYFFVHQNKKTNLTLPVAKILPQPTSEIAQPTLIQQPPLTPEQSSPNAHINDTAEWKTYVNTKYNYTLRYPPEWEPATCSYAATETGVVRDLIPGQLDNVEFHRIGWDCPPTDAPWPRFGIYVKDDKPTDPQFFPPVLYDGTYRGIEQKPEKQIGDKSYFIYWIVEKEPSPGLDNQIMYYLKDNGKIFSFQVYNKDNISTLEKILSTFTLQ